MQHIPSELMKEELDAQNTPKETVYLEIECKFEVTSTLEEYFATRCEADSIEKIFMCDIYYDNSTYSLTSKDLWLRKRNNTFELKWPQDSIHSHSAENSAVDSYNETSDWDVIYSTIKRDATLQHVQPHPSSHANVEDWLKQFDLVPFAVITTHRTRYPVDIFLEDFNFNVKVNIDCDEVVYGEGIDINCGDNFTYCLGEVEITSFLPHGSDPRVVMFAILQNLKIISAECGESRFDSHHIVRHRGKVEEFLFRYRPSHYDALYKKST